MDRWEIPSDLDSDGDDGADPSVSGPRIPRVPPPTELPRVPPPTGASSSSSGGGVLPAHPPPPPAPAAPAPELLPRAGRGANSFPVGPFSISMTFRDGDQRGWGANCGKHLDRGSTQSCKKSITYGLDPTKMLSDDECICKMKLWLIRGMDIAADGPTCRSDHVKGSDARTLPVHSHAELDDMLRARGFAP